MPAFCLFKLDIQSNFIISFLYIVFIFYISVLQAFKQLKVFIAGQQYQN